MKNELYVSDLIGEYLEYVEIELGRSLNTVRNYELYLNRFLELASEDLDHDLKPEEINPELLRKYRLRLNRLEDERGHHLTPATQA